MQGAGERRQGSTGGLEHGVHPDQRNNTADWESMSAGETFTVAIRKDGTLWAWGNNSRDGALKNSCERIGGKMQGASLQSFVGNGLVGELYLKL